MSSAGRTTRGMTLLETMVASTIVVLMLLSLLGVIAFALKGVGTAEGHQDATFHATRLMELIRERQLALSTGFNDPASARIPIATAPFNLDFPANTGFSRRLVTQRLSNDPDDYQSKVYRIEVTVFWKAHGRETSLTLNGLTRAL